MEPSSSRDDWQQWVREHSAKLLLFARQQTRSEADAQDVVQESVVESWKRCDADGPPPVGLVFATIRRRAIDLARSNDRRAARELSAQKTGSVPWFDTTIYERELSHAMQEAMQTIPSIYREVITLKIWGELTFDEIAEVLAIPANTAASRYRYGLAELRKHVKGIFA